MHAACLAFLFTATVAATSADAVQTFTGLTMGTSYTVRIVPGQAAVDLVELHQSIDRRLERLNDQMSNWRPDSELSQFNRSTETGWFAVSPETAEVVAAALRISEQTGGVFDVTVGPLVALWQFGPDARPTPPSAAEVAAVRERVGWRLLEARSDPPALRKQRPDLDVDLSAIAKGFAVDDVARLLEARGIDAYLVEIGGELRTRGVKPDGSRWVVGIESPTPERRGVQRRIEATELCLATSGDYRNFREDDGQRWSHTIDPRTGRPADHALASVTVVAGSCMEADALATALMVLGLEAAYDWSEANRVAALLIVRESGQFQERATSEFARRFPSSSPANTTLTVTVLLAVLIVGGAMAAMAVGLLGRRPLRGSCGGLSALCDARGHPACEACRPPTPAAREPDDGRPHCET